MTKSLIFAPNPYLTRPNERNPYLTRPLLDQMAKILIFLVLYLNVIRFLAQIPILLGQMTKIPNLLGLSLNTTQLLERHLAEPRPTSTYILSIHAYFL